VGVLQGKLFSDVSFLVKAAELGAEDIPHLSLPFTCSISAGKEKN
jgi:hypothetical protein